MSRPLFTNNASTVLARAITPTDTILQLTAGTGQYFPQPTIGDYFMLTLVQVNNPEVSEIVECIERVGDVLTVVRGQEGTQPQIFNISDSVELRITAGSLNLFAIGGGGGGSASGTSVADFTATQGQTVFTLPFSYTQGIDNLAIFINGSKQVVNVNYTESTSTSFTMASGLNAGDVVQAIYNLPLAGGVINSSNVTYNEQSTGAVNRTVQSKLQEIVSVQDFGFSTSNTASQNKAAFVAAIASLTRPSYLYVPQGFYNIAPGIDLGTNCYGIQGAGKYETYLASTTGTSLFTATANPFQYFSLKDIGLQGSSTQYGFYAATMNHSLFENVLFTGFTTCALYLGGYSNDIVECDIFSNTGSGINLNGTLNNVNVNNNRIYANGGIGIYINPTDVNAGLQINITGNAIEANAVAGIIAFNNKALNIKNNYTFWHLFSNIQVPFTDSTFPNPCTALAG